MTENETMALIEKLYKALDAANDHLEFCGFGDSYERECAEEGKLPETIDQALKATTNEFPHLRNAG